MKKSELRYLIKEELLKEDFSFSFRKVMRILIEKLKKLDSYDTKNIKARKIEELHNLVDQLDDLWYVKK